MNGPPDVSKGTLDKMDRQIKKTSKICEENQKQSKGRDDTGL